MLGEKDNQRNFLDDYLYQRLLPSDELLLKIDKEIDFSFIFEETRDLYSKEMGRPSYPPEVLFKMLFIAFYYNLSDVEVARQCQYNLLFRKFIGLKVEDPTPDDTTLVKFRTRLGENRFKRIFNKIVSIAKERGLLKERIKAVDATHIIANMAIPTTINLIRQGKRKLLIFCQRKIDKDKRSV